MLLLSFRIAIRALGRNKLRTALTMLGMMIGVAAVITIAAKKPEAIHVMDLFIMPALSRGDFRIGVWC